MKLITSILIALQLPLMALPPVLEDRLAESRQIVAKMSHSSSDVLAQFDATLPPMVEELALKDDTQGIQIVLTAVEFAARKHKGQVRKDAAATPYIIHPIGVARLLWEIGQVRSVNVLAAAFLHDTLEDTETTKEELEKLFGPRICLTVEEVSNDPSLTTHENKQRQVDEAPTLSLNAQLVKLADRLYNVRDLRTPPPSWTPEQVARYKNWGALLLHALRGTNANLEEALQQELLQ